MRRILMTAVLAILAGMAGSAVAQTSGGLEVCNGSDWRCQSSGTVPLACMDADAIGDASRWRNTGDAMRVQDNRWQMYYASNNRNYECETVLVYRGPVPGWGLRTCAGDDRGCQLPGQAAYACYRESTAAGQPGAYLYTGDAMRVANNRWQVWYAHNQRSHDCESVLVGNIPFGYESQVRSCAGDDLSCQADGAIPLLCDIRGDGFSNPADWSYTGRSMRVRNGQWQMQYPNQALHTCETVIVAMPGSDMPPALPDIPIPGSAQLPTGTVIFFDGAQCPTGWSSIGQVYRPGSPVSGMSYCRRQ